MGNPYVLATISAPENLAKLNRLVEINRRLADPRGLTRGGGEAAGAGRARVLFRLRHDPLDRGRQHPVADRDRAPAGDRHQRRHQADPRQRRRAARAVAESRRPVPGRRSLVQDEGHAVHARPIRTCTTSTSATTTTATGSCSRRRRRGSPSTSRTSTSRSSRTTCTSRGPADRGSSCRRSTIPTIRTSIRSSRRGSCTVGQAMASALVSEGKGGVEWLARYDLWAPARQYMLYHGQPRILTEIASVNLADPLVNANGAPMGPQEPRWNFPLPYRKSDWRLRDIVDYGNTAAFAGMAHVAKYRAAWLENFYKIHADWVNRTEAALRVRRPRGAARSVRDVRDARHPAHRRGRDPPGEGAVQGRRQGLRGGLVGDQDRAAVRRVREDDARAAEVSGPAAVSRRTAQAAVRRHRPHARDADGRRRSIRSSSRSRRRWSW